MILTEKMLQEYIQQNRISITKEKTQEILQVLGNEPDNHYEWSEQDLYEHLRKLIKQSNFLSARPGVQFFAEYSYPSCVKSWEENWDILSTFFAYPAEVRRIIYTTNIIEGLNRQFQSITKTKPSFTNDDSLRKMLYLASKKIVEHWTARCRNWDQVLNRLDIMFSEQNAG